MLASLAEGTFGWSNLAISYNSTKISSRKARQSRSKRNKFLHNWSTLKESCSKHVAQQKKNNVSNKWLQPHIFSCELGTWTSCFCSSLTVVGSSVRASLLGSGSFLSSVSNSFAACKVYRWIKYTRKGRHQKWIKMKVEILNDCFPL